MIEINLNWPPIPTKELDIPMLTEFADQHKPNRSNPTGPINGSVDNILDVYDNASQQQLRAGALWYWVANHISTTIAPGVGPGVVAAMSPSMRWDRNLVAAWELVSTGSSKWQTGANNQKARDCLTGVWSHGKSSKVPSFFLNILLPYVNSPVTVDRHALSVFIGRSSGQRSGRMLEWAGAYQQLIRAYQEAAGMRGVAPHVMQAVVWVSWIEREVG